MHGNAGGNPGEIKKTGEAKQIGKRGGNGDHGTE